MLDAWLAWLTEGLETIRTTGWIGVLWFVVLFVFSCVFFLPGSILTVGAGAIYGFWWGAVLVTISSALGAVVNFLSSRYLARNWLVRKLEKYPKFLVLDRAIEKEGWQLILLSRISPVVPHSLVSYIAGVTGISFFRFTMASLVGFIPISFAYAYVGALLGAVARTRMALTTNDPFTWVMYGVGLLVTVATVYFTTRMATKALRETVPFNS